MAAAGRPAVGSRHQPDPEVSDFVAASLLRWGSDTRAARLFKALKLGRAGAPPAVSTLGVALGTPVERAVAETGPALERARKSGAIPLCVGKPPYPDLLAQIVDPPIVLWALGRLDVLSRPSVALVGSRRATAAGLALARQLGRDLARAGLTVVSGLARGIDAAAHQGALDGGGATVAVLGAGVDVVYPRYHAELARCIRSAGCLVSELPPAAPPLPRHFPLRNRLISGLSLAVVVVEAADRSGSLITARMALEQGRDVLAVPGSVVSGCHRGCHALIKDGAGLVETAEDVLAALGWSGASPPRTRENPAGILGLMRVGEPLGLDELAQRMGAPAGPLLADLGELEVAGQIARMPGGLFVRLD